MRPVFRRILPLVSFLSLVGLPACSSTGAPSPVQAAPEAASAFGAPGTLDDARIEAATAQYKSFAKVNKTAYPTRQHAGNPLVDVYANAVAELTYRAIDFGVAPDGPSKFQPGAMLVKAMLDPNGAGPILTVMYKKASGYDPTHDDWWYGRLNADGSPTNAAFVGTVDFCVSCHSGAATTDYAWGVSSTNK